MRACINAQHEEHKRKLEEKTDTCPFVSAELGTTDAGQRRHHRPLWPVMASPSPYSQTLYPCSTTHRIAMDTTNGDATIRARKIPFVTNSESGQANTIMAMALEATTRPHVEVHIASFPVLKRRVEREDQLLPTGWEGYGRSSGGAGVPHGDYPTSSSD